MKQTHYLLHSLSRSHFKQTNSHYPPPSRSPPLPPSDFSPANNHREPVAAGGPFRRRHPPLLGSPVTR
ncbi:hypothetical protein HanPSC8_Chr09g0357741 [Helianthus annuus]|nr:hypothetical protein HanPSC8_Chr09g0357741 [Helianthus annuus]